MMNHNKFMGTSDGIEFLLQIEIEQDQIINIPSCVQHFLTTSKKPTYIACIYKQVDKIVKHDQHTILG